MYEAERYRYNAAECLVAANDPRQPDYRKLNFSMAALWFALAAADEAVANLVASWDIPSSSKLAGLVQPIPGHETKFSRAMDLTRAWRSAGGHL